MSIFDELLSSKPGPGWISQGLFWFNPSTGERKRKDGQGKDPNELEQELSSSPSSIFGSLGSSVKETASDIGRSLAAGAVDTAPYVAKAGEFARDINPASYIGEAVVSPFMDTSKTKENISSEVERVESFANKLAPENPPKNKIQSIAKSAIRSLPTTAAQMGAFALNPVLGTASLISGEAGQARDSAAQYTGSEPASLAIATGVGVASGALERVGLKGLLGDYVSAAGDASRRAVAQKLFAIFGIEPATEGAQTIVQELGNIAAGKSIDDVARDLPNQLQHSVGASIFTGPIVSGIGTGAQSGDISKTISRDNVNLSLLPDLPDVPASDFMSDWFTTSGRFKEIDRTVGESGFADRIFDLKSNSTSKVSSLFKRVQFIQEDYKQNYEKEIKARKESGYTGNIREGLDSDITSLLELNSLESYTDSSGNGISPDLNISQDLSDRFITKDIIDTVGFFGQGEKYSLRKTSDDLSLEALSKSDFLKGKSRGTVADNLGTYLRREYQNWNDPEWKDTVKSKERWRWDGLFSKLKSGDMFLGKVNLRIDKVNKAFDSYESDGDLSHLINISDDISRATFDQALPLESPSQLYSRDIIVSSIPNLDPVVKEEYSKSYEKREEKLYDLFNIDRNNFSKKKLRSSFRKLAKDYHPNMPGGDSRVFIRIRAAYDLLNNDDLRSRYNTELDNHNEELFFTKIERVVNLINPHVPTQIEGTSDQVSSIQATRDRTILNLAGSLLEKGDPSISQRLVNGELDVTQALSEYQDSRISGYMEDLLNAEPEVYGVASTKQSVGRKGLSEFMERKIPKLKDKELQKAYESFLGLYSDPMQRFSAGVSRLGYDLALHDLHLGIEQDGVGKFLFETPVNQFSEKVGDDKGRSPLAKYYTTPHIANIIRGSDVSRLDIGEVLNTYMKAVRAVRLGKTVGNIPQGMIRNVMAWPMISVATGNSLPTALGAVAGGIATGNPAGVIGGAVLASQASRMLSAKSGFGVYTNDPGTGTWMDGFKDAFYVLASKVNLNNGESLSKKLDNYGLWHENPRILRDQAIFLSENGLLDESVLGQEIKEFSDSLPVGKKILKAMGDLWSKGDDAGKFVIFQSEMENHLDIFKDRLIEPGKPIPDNPLSRDDIAKIVSRKVVDITPTYSRAIPAARYWRDRQPFFSDFPLWSTEVIRNSKNIVKIGISEINEGRKSGNNKLIALGTRRLTGILAATIGFSTAVDWASSVFDSEAEIDDEDKEAIRRLSAPWQRNSDLLVQERKNSGEVTFVDLGFSNPYTAISSVVRAGAIEGQFDEKAWSAIEESYQQQVGMKVLTSAVMDAHKKDDPNSPTKDRIQSVARELFKAAPGLMLKLTDIAGSLDIPYINRYVPEYKRGGVKRDIGSTLGSMFLGMRIEKHDPVRTLGFRARGASKAYRSISSGLKGWMSQRPNASIEDIESEVQGRNDDWRVVFDEMKGDVKAVRHLLRDNVEAEQLIEDSFKNSNGSYMLKKEIVQAIINDYPFYPVF